MLILPISEDHKQLEEGLKAAWHAIAGFFTVATEDFEAAWAAALITDDSIQTPSESFPA